jgi:hypothetical protein
MVHVNLVLWLAMLGAVLAPALDNVAEVDRSRRIGGGGYLGTLSRARVPEAQES